MRLRRPPVTLVALAASLLVLAACGGGDGETTGTISASESSTTSPGSPTTRPASSTTEPAPPTTTAAPSTTAAPAPAPTTTQAPAPTTTQAPAPTAPPAPVQVQIVDLDFAPAMIQVKAGQTVRWTHAGDLSHTVTSRSAGFDSGILRRGGTFELTPTTPGTTINYVCLFHSTMQGVIVVTA